MPKPAAPTPPAFPKSAGSPPDNPASSGMVDSGDIRGKTAFPPPSNVPEGASAGITGGEPPKPEAKAAELATAVPFSNEAASLAQTAVDQADMFTDEYLSVRWVEYQRNLGSMGDWSGATETQRVAFRRLLKSVVADARR